MVDLDSVGQGLCAKVEVHTDKEINHMYMHLEGGCPVAPPDPTPPVSTPPTIPAPPTSIFQCGVVKQAYKSAKCCGNPTSSMSLEIPEKVRRLSSNEESGVWPLNNPHNRLFSRVSEALAQAQKSGGLAQAAQLAERIQEVIRLSLP